MNTNSSPPVKVPQRSRGTFVRDRAAGEVGERALADLLKTVFPVRPASGRTHDVEVEVDGVWLAVEVKADNMAARTGNLAVEWINERTGEASGLLATRATLWVVVLGREVWAAHTSRMRQVFHGGGHLRDVRYAGDGNARVRLFAKAALLGPHLVRLDTLEAGDLCSTVRSLLVEGLAAGQPFHLKCTAEGSTLLS